MVGVLTQVASATEPSNLSGFYVGLNAGWNWNKVSTTALLTGSATTSVTDTASGNGVVGGLQFGYNWQTMPNWMLGVEADFQGSAASATGSQQPVGLNPSLVGAVISESFSRADSLDWFGTVRGRVGYAIWPGITLYGTGGLAYGHVTETISRSFTRFVLSFPPATDTANTTLATSAIKEGWTAGVGIEGLVPNTQVTWKVEYLYVDLAAAGSTFNQAVFVSNPFQVANTMSGAFGVNIIRAGFNLHLN